MTFVCMHDDTGSRTVLVCGEVIVRVPVARQRTILLQRISFEEPKQEITRETERQPFRTHGDAALLAFRRQQSTAVAVEPEEMRLTPCRAS